MARQAYLVSTPLAVDTEADGVRCSGGPPEETRGKMERRHRNPEGRWPGGKYARRCGVWWAASMSRNSYDKIKNNRLRGVSILRRIF